MKKKIAVLMTAAALMLAGGCGSSEQNSAADSGSPEIPVTDITEKETAGQEKTEEKTEEKTDENGTRSLSMSVSHSDGKLNISRAENKNTPMGEEDTWTVFVYLCGTDLESSGDGSGTADLEQMLAATGSDSVRFVIQTGGTSQWLNSYFSADANERWVVQDQKAEKVDSSRLSNMGSADTLRDFLEWGVQNYPAAKMGFIFWDHGGGSIYGCCEDELNNFDSLELKEMNSAFSQAYEKMSDKFEFIGFDCCLMSTVETANILASYARYFYGSQEAESGTGWDYAALGSYLAGNPGTTGADLGKVIADSYYEECAGEREEDSATMTVLDLEKLDDFTVAFNDYAEKLYGAAEDNLNGIVRGIKKADNFGGNNPSEGYSNMVDIGGILDNCSSYADGSSVKEALKNCIVYCRNGRDHAKASGLSIFYPLESQGSDELNIFSGICISPYYLSLVDMVSKGYSDSGYSNEGLFSDEGDWTCEGCESFFLQEDYFDYADEDSVIDSSLITFAREPYVNDSGYFGFRLDERGIEYASSVTAMIYMKQRDGDLLVLGETDDVYGDWETGEFEDNFDGYWMALPDGTLISAFIAEMTEEYTVFTSPVTVNGTRTNLRIRQFSDRTVVEGTWDGIGENGMASREVRKLKAGDQLRPVYQLMDDTEIEGDIYTWKENDDLVYAVMPAADYYYSFAVEDAYGNCFYSPVVVFTIDEDGEIVFNVEETEAENDVDVEGDEGGSGYWNEDDRDGYDDGYHGPGDYDGRDGYDDGYYGHGDYDDRDGYDDGYYGHGDYDDRDGYGHGGYDGH